MTETAVAAQTDRVDALQAAVTALFGQAPVVDQVREACAAAQRDLHDIADGRGLAAPLVAVIGDKSAGKSTVCDALLRAAGQTLQAGAARRDRQRLHWFTPQAPARLDASLEDWLPVSPLSLPGTSQPFALVDVPALNDDSALARRTALQVLPLSSLIVLVVSWESGLELDALLQYLRQANGAVVLPLVVDDHYTQRDAARASAELDAFHARLRATVPGSTVLAPQRLPRWSAAPEEQQTALREEADRHAVQAVSRALRQAPAGRAAMARQRYQHLEDTLQPVLAPLLSAIAPSVHALQQSRSEAAETLAGTLVGAPEQLEAGVRLRMYAAVLERTARWCFPYRTLLGLLTLTAGAWDRLTLSLAGSLPSLALVVFQGGRNLRALDQQRDAARQALAERLAQRLQQTLAEPQAAFVAAVSRAVDEPATALPETAQPVIPAAALPGLEERAEAAVREAVQGALGGQWINRTAGVLALLLWVGLLLGPLLGLYGDYLATAWQIVVQGDSAAWRVLPAPGFGVLFTALLLSVLPVMALAMLALLLTVTRRRVRRCAALIRERLGELLAGSLLGVLRQSRQRADDPLAATLLLYERLAPELLP